MSENQYKEYSPPQYPGITIVLKYFYPKKAKNSDRPCYCRAKFKSKKSGHFLTRREVDERADDHTYETNLRGVDRADIYQNLVPELAIRIAQKLPPDITGHLSDKPLFQPLDELLEEHKDDFFKEKYSRIAPSRYRHYSGQYKILQDICKGIDAATLDSEAYAALLDRIISSANDTRRKSTVKESLSSSAKTRLTLLCRAIWYLKERYGDDFIPVSPTVPERKKSRQEEIKDLMCEARSFPHLLRESFRKEPLEKANAFGLFNAIKNDTGCRISEASGLVWGDLKRIDGSQGTMYILGISGQLGENGKRTDKPKSKNGLRYIPLNQKTGEALDNRKHTSDCTMILADLRAEDTGEPLDERPCAMRALRNQLEEYQKAIFNKPAARKAFWENLPHNDLKKLIPKSEQKKHLYGSLTSHLCRRNFCTEMYSRGGHDEDTIRRMMGHELEKKGEMAQSDPLTEQELYQLALKYQTTLGVCRTVYTLQYNVCGEYQKAEITNCRCRLTIPAGKKAKIIIATREPSTNIHVLSDSANVTVQEPIANPAATTPDGPVVFAANTSLKPCGTIFDDFPKNK